MLMEINKNNSFPLERFLISVYKYTHNYSGGKNYAE